MTSPYHPEYGLPDDHRREVLRTAALLSVRLAASIHRVSVSTVYRWQRDFAAAAS